MKRFSYGFALLSMALCFLAEGLRGAEGALHLTVDEGFQNPIGFYDATPVFSWQLPAQGVAKSQSAYRIVAATKAALLPENADLWDSTKVTSDQSAWVGYAGKPLESRQKVYWQVQVWDEKDRACDWSDVATFELGLLANTDWKAHWIGLDSSAASQTGRKAATLTITKAVYGARGDAGKQVDVTEILRKQVASGRRTVKASNDLAGDPANLTVKELVVDYLVDGKAQRRTIPEGKEVNLVTGQGAAQNTTFIPQVLRREFALAGPVEQARLYVTAKGLYEVQINGRKVGADYMVPGWTPYQKRIETLTYDATNLLTQGENAIGAILAEGWYAGNMMGKRFKYPEAKPRLLVQLEILYKDGTTQTVVSDEHWKGSDQGPIRSSSIYDGEVYDARLEMPNWSRVDYNDTQWRAVVSEELDPQVKLVPKRHAAVRAAEELKAVSVTEPAKGKYVFDLGQNMVGWPRLRIPVKRDMVITVRVAEMLNKDGTLYTANYRAAKSTDYYTAAKDGTVIWSPKFTFHGFRYVELSGFQDGAKPNVDWVTGVVLHSAFKQSGQFVSSHKKLNQLQRNITWGQRGNFLDIPTDCPQRNERLGWTGDAQVFCSTSIFNYDVLAFWMSWLQSAREEQGPDGLVHHVVPATIGGKGSPGWGDVAVVAPWELYVRTGRRAVLEENYEMMKRWTAAYEREAKGYIVARRGFGDWLQPYPKSKGNKADTPMDLIATAYFGRCTGIMQKTAVALGKHADAARYAKLFGKIQSAFSTKFFDEHGRLTTQYPTQTGYLMALGYDLLPEKMRAGAVQGLLEVIDEAGGHLRTGFLGTPLIAPVLDRFGHPDIAYSVLFKETYPSWFFSINQGATTMWERWNSYSHADGFGNAGMNSFNHYAYGAIGQWMYERIAGLAPDPEHPGYKHFFIKPLPGGPLTSASAKLETPYGTAKSAWKLKDGALQVTVSVPPNTTATPVIPPGAPRASVPKVLGPGDHQFTIRLK